MTFYVFLSCCTRFLEHWGQRHSALRGDLSRVLRHQRRFIGHSSDNLGLQGVPAKVKPVYNFAGNILMRR